MNTDKVNIVSVDQSARACPKCGGKSGVIDTRGVMRKRECDVCGFHWLTEEVFRRSLPIDN